MFGQSWVLGLNPDWAVPGLDLDKVITIPVKFKQSVVLAMSRRFWVLALSGQFQVLALVQILAKRYKILAISKRSGVSRFSIDQVVLGIGHVQAAMCFIPDRTILCFAIDRVVLGPNPVQAIWCPRFRTRQGSFNLDRAIQDISIGCEVLGIGLVQAILGFTPDRVVSDSTPVQAVRSPNDI